MKYFIVCYGGGHVTMCLPVIEMLAARGHEVSVLALTIAGPYLTQHAIVHHRPIDYVDIESVRLYGEILAKKHHTEDKGISYDESVAYLGISFENLARDIGESKAWQHYEKYGLRAFCPVHFMKQVLVREAPDMVISTTAPRMEKAALNAAFALGIPSLCMLDLFGIMDFTMIASPDNGDYLTVYHDKIKRRYAETGRAAERIFITGNPAFDTLAPYKNNTAIAAAYRQKKNIRSDAKIILWAEQPEPEDPTLPQRVREHLMALCATHETWQLVVRFHPGTTHVTPPIIPDDVRQSYAHESLQEVLCAADVVVTLTSTVGMEALLLDKSTLIIAISPYQHFVDYTEEDGAFIVPSLAETEDGLQQLLSHSEKAQRLADARRKLPPVGEATQKIVTLVEHIAAQGC